jgi:hypothetical protein
MDEIVIDDEDDLLRRVHVSFHKGNGVLSSSAYKRNSVPENQASVDLERLTTLRDSVNRAGRPGFLLARIAAKWPRSLDLEIVHIPELGNDAHCEIRGENTQDKCNQLAERSRLVCNIMTDGTEFDFPDTCE